MKHKTNQTLYQYWLRRRGQRNVPLRRDIEPSDIHRELPDTFILQCDAEGAHGFRIAGSRICSLYGREMKGVKFIDLWHGEDRETIRAGFMSMHQDAMCMLIGWKALTATRETLQGETLMLPLGTERDEMTRILGTMVPMSVPYWLGILPIVSLNMKTVRMITPEKADAKVFGARRTAIGSARSAANQPVFTQGHLALYLGGRHDEVSKEH